MDVNRIINTDKWNEGVGDGNGAGGGVSECEVVSENGFLVYI